MAQSNSGNGTGKPTQKQNYPGTASKDSADKETNNHDFDDLDTSLELVHELTIKEVINTIRDMITLNIVMIQYYLHTILLESSVLGKQIALVHVRLVLVLSSVATTSLVG